MKLRRASSRKLRGRAGIWIGVDICMVKMCFGMN